MIMENAFARISSDSKKTNRKNASGKNLAITVRKMQFVKMENVLASGAIQDKLQIIFSIWLRFLKIDLRRSMDHRILLQQGNPWTRPISE